MEKQPCHARCAPHGQACSPRQPGNPHLALPCRAGSFDNGRPRSWPAVYGHEHACACTPCTRHHARSPSAVLGSTRDDDPQAGAVTPAAMMDRYCNYYNYYYYGCSSAFPSKLDASPGLTNKVCARGRPRSLPSSQQPTEKAQRASPSPDKGPVSPAHRATSPAPRAPFPRGQRPPTALPWPTGGFGFRRTGQPSCCLLPVSLCRGDTRAFVYFFSPGTEGETCGSGALIDSHPSPFHCRWGKIAHPAAAEVAQRVGTSFAKIVENSCSATWSRGPPGPTEQGQTAAQSSSHTSKLSDLSSGRSSGNDDTNHMATRCRGPAGWSTCPSVWLAYIRPVYLSP